MDEIKLTIVIPVYNQEKLIIKALDSIPAVDYIDTIVIDDCSTDKTFENVKKYIVEHCDKNICLLYNKDNKGVGYTVNKGLDNVLGEDDSYIVLLGSDDTFDTKSLLYVAENCLKGNDLVYFDLRLNDGTVWKVTPQTKRNICGSVKFMRKGFVGDTRCPNKNFGEDFDFYQELLKKNPTELFTGMVVKNYNFPRVGSLTYQNTKK